MKELKHITKRAFLTVALLLLLAGQGFAEQINWDDTMLTSKATIDASEAYESIETTSYFESYQREILYSEPENLTVKKENLKKEDILKAVPSISTDDNKTLGLLIPPFAYFAKRF